MFSDLYTSMQVLLPILKINFPSKRTSFINGRRLCVCFGLGVGLKMCGVHAHLHKSLKKETTKAFVKVPPGPL